MQHWNGSNWVTVPGGTVTANNKVWRKFSFVPISTSKVRVVSRAVAGPYNVSRAVAGPYNYNRITELDAYSTH